MCLRCEQGHRPDKDGLRFSIPGWTGSHKLALGLGWEGVPHEMTVYANCPAPRCFLRMRRWNQEMLGVSRVEPSTPGAVTAVFQCDIGHALKIAWNHPAGGRWEPLRNLDELDKRLAKV